MERSSNSDHQIPDTGKLDEIKIINTNKDDWNKVLWLFRITMEHQGKNGYKVWESIDEENLMKDIEKKLQFKILQGEEIICIFSIQLNDPLIWGERDKNDAIYLHRIVVNPSFKGHKLFEKVLNWSREYANQHHLKFIRMDTWADNTRIIEYYKSFGFEFIGNYKTGNEHELPIQNRNLVVALLEMTLPD